MLRFCFCRTRQTNTHDGQHTAVQSFQQRRARMRALLLLPSRIILMAAPPFNVLHSSCCVCARACCVHAAACPCLRRSAPPAGGGLALCPHFPCVAFSLPQHQNKLSSFPPQQPWLHDDASPRPSLDPSLSSPPFARALDSTGRSLHLKARIGGRCRWAARGLVSRSPPLVGAGAGTDERRHARLAALASSVFAEVGAASHARAAKSNPWAHLPSWRWGCESFSSRARRPMLHVHTLVCSLLSHTRHERWSWEAVCPSLSAFSACVYYAWRPYV